MSILDAYSQISFSCLVSPLKQVLSAVREILQQPVFAYPFLEEQCEAAVARIYYESPPPGGAHAKKVLFFAPVVAPQLTVMFANLSDGWQTLAIAVSKELSCRSYRFAMGSTRAEWPLYCLEVCDSGQLVRYVSLIRDDDRWVFYQRGEPLPEERLSTYEKTRVSSRLTRQDLVQLANRLGLHVDRDEFWESATKGVCFEELRSPGADG